LCDLPDLPGAIAVSPRERGTCGGSVDGHDDIVQAVTDAVMAALAKG
jgi:hypothetical protein